MKAKIVVLTISVLALSMFIIPAVLAECPEGKVEVTIVQGKSGKVMVLCIPETAARHIGGPNDRVILATCPCFSYEKVEAAIERAEKPPCGNMELGVSQDEEVSWVIGLEADSAEFRVKQKVGEPDFYEDYEFGGNGCSVSETPCQTWGWCHGPDSHCSETYTRDELEACVAILRNLRGWEITE